MKEKDQPSRREFCAATCQGAAFAALGLLLEGCGGGAGGGVTGPSAPSLPVIDATIAGGTITFDIDSASPLAPVGGAALVRTSGGSVLVAHTAAEAFVALGSTCTHQNCTITGFANGVYVCPCHGSQFSTSGQVLRGPAPSALGQVRTAFSNNRLVIG